MKPFLTLQSVFEHIRAFPILSEESVSLDAVLGRRLARAFAAPQDLPGFDRSTVDGFAVRARDVCDAQEGNPALVECVADCRMGVVLGVVLREGQAARILTGGMLPEGADCVVMVEFSRSAGGDLIELTRSQDPGDNVILRDDDAARRQRAAAGRAAVAPQDLGPVGDLRPLYAAEPIVGVSGLISGMSAADGLLVCPENREGYNIGDLVMVELFS